jgi:uncharacterized protein (TIGR00730 family)
MNEPARAPRRITVFCGSSAGARPEYLEAARALGARLARDGIGLVYGGASVGTMGAVADAALEAGGEVIGVLLLDHAVAEGFVRRDSRALLLVDADAGRLLDGMHAWRSPVSARWLGPDET